MNIDAFAALAMLIANAAPPRQAELVAVYTEFQRPCPRATFDAMREELETIMEPTGVELEWRTAGGPGAHEPANAVVVVTVRGSCRAGDLFHASAGSGALRWTHVSDGAVLPFSEIDCDRVGGHIGRLLAHVEPGQREALFGRALARVLAHEMYHALAGTMRHGKAGVAKPAHSAVELLADYFSFDERDCDALRDFAVQ